MIPFLGGNSASANEMKKGLRGAFPRALAEGLVEMMFVRRREMERDFLRVRHRSRELQHLIRKRGSPCQLFSPRCQRLLVEIP